MTDAARRVLAEAHVEFALRSARRLTRDLPWLADEMESEAMVCLWRAATSPRYDPSRSFRPYLGRCLRHAFYDLLSAGGWARGDGPEGRAWWGQVADHRGADDPGDPTATTDRMATVRASLARLPREDAAVLRYRYGLANSHTAAPARMGREFSRRYGRGVRARLDAIEARAIGRLRLLLVVETA